MTPSTPSTAHEEPTHTPPPRATRRRGAALETAIHAAVLELLTEQGVAGVTMEAVAVRAGTSKPVLYRRWDDRGALLRDTLVSLAQSPIPHEDTGTYRADMLAILHGWAEFFTSPAGLICRAVVGAMPHDPELTAAFQEGVIGWRKEAMANVLNRGIARGEIRPDVRVDVARELGQDLLGGVVLEIERFDLDEIAFALSDQNLYDEHRHLIDPETGHGGLHRPRPRRPLSPPTCLRDQRPRSVPPVQG